MIKKLIFCEAVYLEPEIYRDPAVDTTNCIYYDDFRRGGREADID